jgi:predicted 2-oxoglutarate/Fe(II)-dependent dioxygenase YbiX
MIRNEVKRQHSFEWWLTNLRTMEVTLNVCLGDKFDGGNLHFWGLRGEHVGGNKLLGEYQPEVGRAVIHSGRHLHEVTPITAGDRFALIQWTRSWKSARRETCPCCWLNRRRDSDSEKGNSCICGPRWN